MRVVVVGGMGGDILLYRLNLHVLYRAWTSRLFFNCGVKARLLSFWRRSLFVIVIVDNVVKLVKAPDKDGDRESEDENSKECTETGNNTAAISQWDLVAIANLKKTLYF